ncbi:SDR family oxidoreductase [Clostridium sp. AWRP]|uniref:SDR family oxidoreductase n=1 Tax=Clostridium sp. AWRP TaxID=2212991 RepID=UPI000FDC75EB|nr:SDR family oxidoreductase [Clostridium sp. AWRP]AZV57485.1 SDR family oxidoreductase [Clostridium sp. AWRP]
MHSNHIRCKFPRFFPPQHQPHQPGIEYIMTPRPIFEPPLCAQYQTGKRLLNKVALITGGDSGIGRAVACAYAKEGADIAIVYLNEHVDAEETKSKIEKLGRRCLTIPINIGVEENSKIIIQEVINHFGKLDILVNNAAVLYYNNSIEEVSSKQLEWTFRINVFSYFYLTKAALPYMKPGSSIINTSSLVAFNPPYGISLEYEASKAAVANFTINLARSLISKGIRVNGVAPGETWTPLIPAGLPADKVAVWGSKTPMGRAAQPFEVAPAYVFLASNESSYMSGQTIHMYS